MNYGIAGALLLCGAALAEVSEPAIVTRLRSNYGSGTTLETQFEARIYWEAREKEEVKNGRLILAPGDKFRVELGGALWVSDGKTLWQYSRESRQVIVRALSSVDLSEHPSQIIARYLTGARFRMKSETETHAVLETALGAPQADTRIVEVYVDKKSATIARLVVREPGGNRSSYSFRQTRLGRTVAAGVFAFETPKDAQVLDMRQ